MFEDRLAVTIAGWAGTPEESMVWCSLSTVSADTVVEWSASSSVEAFVLVEEGDVVAYGEIWIDVDENEVELAHLIVAPERRDHGLGRRLVSSLVEQAKRHYPVVAMRVHSHNAAAIRCYAASGFARASDMEEKAWNEGQPVAYVWMTHP